MATWHSLIFISVIIVVVYSVGLWAGRNLEREIEADKIKEAAELKKKAAKANRR